MPIKQIKQQPSKDNLKIAIIFALGLFAGIAWVLVIHELAQSQKTWAVLSHLKFAIMVFIILDKIMGQCIMILLMITYLQWLALHVVVICEDQLAKL